MLCVRAATTTSRANGALTLYVVSLTWDVSKSETFALTLNVDGDAFDIPAGKPFKFLGLSCPNEKELLEAVDDRKFGKDNFIVTVYELKDKNGLPRELLFNGIIRPDTFIWEKGNMFRKLELSSYWMHGGALLTIHAYCIVGGALKGSAKAVDIKLVR